MLGHRRGVVDSLVVCISLIIHREDGAYLGRSALLEDVQSDVPIKQQVIPRSSRINHERFDQTNMCKRGTDPSVGSALSEFSRYFSLRNDDIDRKNHNMLVKGRFHLGYLTGLRFSLFKASCEFFGHIDETLCPQQRDEMFVRHKSAYGRSEKKEALFREVGFLYELALFANAIFVFAYQSLACDFATRLGDFSGLLLSRYSLSNNAPSSSQLSPLRSPFS